MPHPPDIAADLKQIAETAQRYLREANVNKETRPEMLSEGGMMEKAKRLVQAKFYEGAGMDPSDFYIVWFSKTLQNWKALVSTNVADDMYYEVTHNGNKSETYLDAYHKVKNICVVD